MCPCQKSVRTTSILSHTCARVDTHSCVYDTRQIAEIERAVDKGALHEGAGLAEQILAGIKGLAGQTLAIA